MTERHSGLRWFGAGAVAAVLLAACASGTDQSDDIGEAPDSPAPSTGAQVPNEARFEVTSDDGMVTLEVLGGTDLTDSITIERGPLDPSIDLPPGAAAVRYDLEPSGLEFARPAAISIQVDASAVEDAPPEVVAFLVSDGEIDVIPADATVASSGVVVTAELEHFSGLGVVLYDSRSRVVVPAPVQTVGVPFEVGLRSYLASDAAVVTSYLGRGSSAVEVVESSLTDPDHGSATLVCADATDGPTQLFFTHSVTYVEGFEPPNFLHAMALMMGAEEEQILREEFETDQAVMNGVVTCAEAQPGSDGGSSSADGASQTDDGVAAGSEVEPGDDAATDDSAAAGQLGPCPDAPLRAEGSAPASLTVTGAQTARDALGNIWVRFCTAGPPTFEEWEAYQEFELFVGVGPTGKEGQTRVSKTPEGNLVVSASNGSGAFEPRLVVHRDGSIGVYSGLSSQGDFDGVANFNSLFDGETGTFEVPVSSAGAPQGANEGNVEDVWGPATPLGQ